MPFARPTLTELRHLALQDVYAVLGVKGLLRFSVLRVLTWCTAGMAHLHFGYLDWIARQSVPFTSTGEFLAAWAALVGITRKQPSSATGTATFFGVVGTPVPAGMVLRRRDGTEYVTLLDATWGGAGTASATMQAQVPGAAGSVEQGAVLSLATPIAGITGAEVGGDPIPGTDSERDEALRTRMLLRFAAPPQGGAASDYLEWALAVPGVTRAWVRPNAMGAGSVTLYTMWDDAEAAHAGFPQGSNGVSQYEPRDIPASGDQVAVADAIYPKRPVTALVYSCAANPYPVSFTIRPKVFVPNTVKALVDAAIDMVFLTYASPIADALNISPFETAIAAVPGMPDFTLTSPGAAIQAPYGSLPVRGTVNYV